GRELAEDEGAPPSLAGVPAAALVAVTSGFAYYAPSGLETLPYALLLFAGARALVRGAPLPFAAWTSLAFLARPGAALLGLLGTAWLAARRDWRGAATAAAAFTLLVTPYLAWKLWYFEALVPNPLQAKQPILADGLEYG